MILNEYIYQKGNRNGERKENGFLLSELRL